jgi:hypothetical protein
MLQVMQLSCLLHALAVVPLPVPSSTCVLAPFTHALTVVPLPVTLSTCVLLVGTIHASLHARSHRGPVAGATVHLLVGTIFTPAFMHALTVVPLPVPSPTCLLAPFTHALTVVPLPVPSSTCLLAPFTHALTVVPLPLPVPSPTCLLADLTEVPADLTEVHAEVPARAALNPLTEIRAVRRAAFGQLMPNQLLETPVLLLGAVDHQRKVPAIDFGPPLGFVSHHH